MVNRFGNYILVLKFSEQGKVEEHSVARGIDSLGDIKQIEENLESLMKMLDVPQMMYKYVSDMSQVVKTMAENNEIGEGLLPIQTLATDEEDGVYKALSIYVKRTK